jgi:hypothetical protein
MGEGSSDRSNPGERRLSPRLLAAFAASVDAMAIPRGESVALIRDVSSNGARLFTRRRYDLGENVELTIHLSADSEDPPLRVSAKVLRVDERSTGVEVWPYAVAVSFPEPREDIVMEMEAAFDRRSSRPSYPM